MALIHQARVIRHQFKRTGLNHLVVCTDIEGYENGTDGHYTSYHVVFGATMCGKETRIGAGGWGHGPKNCTACFAVAAPAVRLRDKS